MTRRNSGAALAALALIPLLVAPVSAQQPQTSVPLKVDVVLTRSQGAKLVSSLPFSLMVTAQERGGNRVSVRTGVNVPIGTSTTERSSSNNSQTTTTTVPQYQYVGTQIDCSAQSDGSQFGVYLNITDTSIYAPDGTTAPAIGNPDAMAFRNFSMSNTLTMAIGQTKTFAVATDKVTGETLKIDVTVSAAK